MARTRIVAAFATFRFGPDRAWCGAEARLQQVEKKKRKDNVEAKECAVALLHAGGRGAVHGGVLGVGCRGDLQDTDARVRGSEIDTDGWSRHVVWEVCA